MLNLVAYPSLPDGFTWSYLDYGGRVDTSSVLVRSTGDGAGTWIARINERANGAGYFITLGLHRSEQRRTEHATRDELVAARFVARWFVLRELSLRKELREVERGKWNTPWRAFLRGDPPPPL